MQLSLAKTSLAVGIFIRHYFIERNFFTNYGLTSLLFDKKKSLKIIYIFLATAYHLLFTEKFRNVVK